jgi:hypothetical protein
MISSIRVVIGIMVCTCACVALGVQEQAYTLCLRSRGGGSWGSADIVYSGRLTVRPESSNISVAITNISRTVDSSDPRATVELSPFSALVSFEDDMDVIRMAVESNQQGRDRRAMGSAYMLTYLIVENAVYPFLGAGGFLSRIKPMGEHGELLFSPRVPETVVSDGFGSVAGKDFNVGPVDPKHFRLLSDAGPPGKESRLTLGWMSKDGPNYGLHLRRMETEDGLPTVTSIMSATVEDGDDNIGQVCTSLLDEGVLERFKSYNRYDIYLKPVPSKDSSMGERAE